MMSRWVHSSYGVSWDCTDLAYVMTLSFSLLVRDHVIGSRCNSCDDPVARLSADSLDVLLSLCLPPPCAISLFPDSLITSHSLGFSIFALRSAHNMDVNFFFVSYAPLSIYSPSFSGHRFYPSIPKCSRGRP